jgi:hypothetical protein
MQQLETKNPTVHRKFEDGFPVISQTDQFWAGLGCDLPCDRTDIDEITEVNWWSDKG